MIAIDYHVDLSEVQGDPVLAALYARESAPFDRLDWYRGLAGDCDTGVALVTAKIGQDRAALVLPGAEATSRH